MYALVYSWRYAAGFVALLLLHEMGYFLAAKGLVHTVVGTAANVNEVTQAHALVRTVDTICC